MAVIASIEFHKVKQPLKQPFITVLQKVEKREVTVVIVRDLEDEKVMVNVSRLIRLGTQKKR